MLSLHWCPHQSNEILWNGDNEVVQSYTNYNCYKVCKKVKNSELKKHYMKLEVNLGASEWIEMQSKKHV